MEVERKIRRMGNSLGIHFPSNIAKQLELEEGQTIYFTFDNEKIIISKHSQNEKDQQFKDKVIKILDEYLEEKK